MRGLEHGQRLLCYPGAVGAELELGISWAKGAHTPYHVFSGTLQGKVLSVHSQSVHSS